MKCSKCQQQNPEGAIFCNGCGYKLEVACPACGKENPPSSKFCNKCGNDISIPLTTKEMRDISEPSHHAQTIPEPVSLGEGERRQATIVFSDLSGYTAMNEKLDPEEVEAIMSRIKKEAIRTVERHEGIVNQFVGDEVLALFGIPTAYEDDPVRAVRAAMELHDLVRQISPEVEERIGSQLRMHTGISTGLVVTHIRDVREGSYGITGDTVNRGARLANRAEADEILVGPQTYSFISPYFRTEALEAETVKGKTQPLILYRVKGASAVHTRFEAAAVRGLTKFTGRDQELASLHSCLKKAMAGNGQFVTVAGVAGAGKSRMIYEFRHSLDKNRIGVLQGRCQSYGTSIPYFPHINVLRRGLNLNEEDIPAELEEKAVYNVLAVNPSLEQYLPLYLHLLSISSKDNPLPEHIEGRELRYAFQEALSAIATLNSRRRPLVLIFEDWHWTDEASDAALRYMIGMISQYPLMILVTYRPDYKHSWNGMSHHTPISLKPLDNLHIESIIKSIYGVKDLSPGFGEFIQTRTGGNPLYIEEVCRSLNEEGLMVINDEQAVLTRNPATLTLPDTLQAIISARLDRLDSDSKETIRLAAVIGKEFNRRILERLYQAQTPLSRTLDKLSAHEMIQQTQIVPEANYRFKHAMTQEVAYETMLLRRRKDLHGQIGNTIEELYTNRLEEYVDLLKYHFGLAENWQKFFHYGCLSAARAKNLSQFQEAAAMYEEVFKCLEQLPEDQSKLEIRIELLLQQECLYEILGQRERQQEIINHLLSLIQDLNVPTYLAEIRIRQGDLFTQLGRFEDAECAFKEALSIWRKLPDLAGESRALRSMGFLRWHQARYNESIEMNESALVIDRKRDDPNAIATDLTNLGAVWRNLGKYQCAIECFETALDIYKTANNPLKQAFTRYSIANVHREQGDLDLAASQYHKAYDIFTKHHDHLMASRALAGRASILWKQGKLRESLNLYKEVVKMTRDIGYAQGLSHALKAMGELLIVLNDTREGLGHLLESTEIFSKLKDKENEALIWQKIANIYDQGLEDHCKAFAAWDKVQELQRLLNDDCGVLQALHQMGKLAWKTFNDPSKALKYYQEAYQFARKMNNHQKQGEFLSSMGNIEWHQGANTKALEYYEKALKVYRGLEDVNHIGLMLNCIGVSLRKLERYEDALDRLQEAVATNHQADQLLFEGHGLAAMGDVYRDMGEHDQALDHYKESLNLRRKIGDRKGEGWMLNSLASVYTAQNSHTLAKDFIEMAYVIADECGDEDLLKACIDGQEQLKLKSSIKGNAVT